MDKFIRISAVLSLLMVAASAVAVAPAQVPATGQSSDVNVPGATKGVAWPSQRFVAGSSATADCITDKLTGLMWPKNGSIGFSNGVSPYTPLATPELNNTTPANNKVAWSSSGSANEVFTALANLNTETLCGYSDWRLPNKVELKSLVNYGAASPANWLMYGSGNSGAPACNGACFTNVQANIYWSSSTSASDTTTAWHVNFNYGGVGADGKTNDLYVWPVRGGL
jgi:hypothetical protein